MSIPPIPPAVVYRVAQSEEFAVVQITIQDALAIGEIVSPAGKPLTIFVQASAGQIVDGSLSARHKEQLLERLYGPNWRSGNDDGSMYILLSYTSSLLSAEERWSGAWRSTPGAWLYQIGADGNLTKLGEGYVSK